MFVVLFSVSACHTYVFYVKTLIHIYMLQPLKMKTSFHVVDDMIVMRASKKRINKTTAQGEEERAREMG